MISFYFQLEQVLHDLFVVHRAFLLLANLFQILHLSEHLVLSSKWKLKCFNISLKEAGSQVHFHCDNLLWILANDPVSAHALYTIAGKSLLAEAFEDVEGPEGSVQPAVSVSITGRDMATVSQNTVTVVLVLAWTWE